MPAVNHLHVVPRSPVEPATARRELDDVGLTFMLFLIAALPLASALAGVGRWDEASLGLGTVGVLFGGRELCARLVAARRARRHP